MPETQLELYASVVEAIYDCALDPSKWRDVLPKIAAFLDSDSSTFALHDMARGDGRRFFDYGLSEAAVRSYFEIYAPLNPTITATPMMQIGEPWMLRMMLPREEFLESRFYKEWCKPNGQGDLMGLLALRAGSRIATHAIAREDGKPEYAIEDLQRYKLIAPHICRALVISDALELKTITSQALESTLDQLSAGVYLVARDRRILYLNAAAQSQLSANGAISAVDNRLLPADQTAASKLNLALAQAAGEEGADKMAGGSSIALPATRGPGLIASVLPLEGGLRRDFKRPFAAVAAVFVQDPKAAVPLPGEAFAKLYKLSASELRVVLAIAPGLPLQETADMLGVSLATVKTHLARIFQKTGTSRQPELIALLMRASPPATGA